MGILVNPNDQKADKYDVAEVIRRKGGTAYISDIVQTLNISEKRANELAKEAAPQGDYGSRVYSPKEGKFKLRY